jgi:hypothetical protein
LALCWRCWRSVGAVGALLALCWRCWRFVGAVGAVGAHLALLALLAPLRVTQKENKTENNHCIARPYRYSATHQYLNKFSKGFWDNQWFVPSPSVRNSDVYLFVHCNIYLVIRM